MDDLKERIIGLALKGFHCSQILMILSHEMRGKSNPELISALGALGGGMFSQKTCGTLTGACCLLADFDTDGDPGVTTTPEMEERIKGLVRWFEETHGSTVCGDLVEYNREAMMKVCPRLMETTFVRCMEILDEVGIDPYE